MQQTFPDVRDGDRLIGLATPGAATKFFMNGKPVGEIEDPAFGPAFFGIWRKGFGMVLEAALDVAAFRTDGSDELGAGVIAHGGNFSWHGMLAAWTT